MSQRTDYDGLAPWEVGLPQLEEFTDGWVGCSKCLGQWTHRVDGVALARAWQKHLMDHARGRM